MTDLETAICEEWVGALQSAHSLLKNERIARFKRRSVPSRFDARGVHLVSEDMGRIAACQQVLPQLRDFGFDPRELEAMAYHDAIEELRAWLLDTCDEVAA